MKPMKDILKSNPHHQFCDFGIKKFNQTKRSQEFVDEMNVLEAAARTQNDNRKPSKPSGVYVTSTTSTLTLNWSASSDNVAVVGYRVTINGGSPITVFALSYQFTGLSSSTSYTLTVAAYDSSGNTSIAASIIGTTLATTTTTTSTSTTTTTTSGEETTTTTTTSTSTSSTTTTSGGGDTTAPTVPIYTSIIASETSLIVSWGASSDDVGVAGYKTEVVGVGVFTTTNTTYTFSGLAPGTTYTVKVYAFDAVGNRSDNAWGTATTLNTTVPPTSSSSVILCDFNGQTVSGTNWNTNGNIVCAPSGLTLSEQDYIVNSMKYDYSAYNIEVTADEAVYNAADPYKRTRVIFTPSWEWYGQAGGVAFIGSFTWGNNTPCFVFTSLLGYNPRYIYTAGSHEAGHTIGLRHQVVCSGSTITNQYNPGDSVNGAPTMGVGYYNTPKWWVGPCSLGCSSIQNDNTILTQALGLHP